MFLQSAGYALIFDAGITCFMGVHSFPLILGCFALLLLLFSFLFFFLSCICYKLLTIRLMKAASSDGPSGLLAACPMFNIEILYCNFFFFWGGGQIKYLLACCRHVLFIFFLLLNVIIFGDVK